MRSATIPRHRNRSVHKHRKAPAPSKPLVISTTHKTATEPDWAARREILAAHIPVAVPNADWQTRLTPNSENFRVLLNGEPIPGALAASYRYGWVDIIETHGTKLADVDIADSDPRKAGLHRLTGYVEIRHEPQMFGW